MALVALRSAYGRIGFSDEAALVITDTQVIYSMEELKILTDGYIDNIFKVIRRSGGINPTTNIANLGLQVPLRDENKLKLSSFFLKHKTKTRRVVVQTDITLNIVRLSSELKKRKRNTQILWYLW